MASELTRLVQLIAGTGADVVLIGGVAIVLNGGDHFTKDVDFAFSRDKATIKKIVDALAQYNPKPLNWPEGLPFVWDEQTMYGLSVIALDTDIGRIDFLSEPDGAPSFKQLQSNSRKVDMEGTLVSVASIDDLIAMKRAAGRPKDLAHIHELQTIKKILAGEL